jgi:hypothetical protein
MSDVDLRFLLGLLNSRLISLHFSAVYGGNKLQGNYLRIGPPQVRTIPLPADVSTFRGEHGAGLSELVDQMLGMRRRQHMAGTRQQRTALERRIVAADQQIDRLVYNLYDLTEEEIRTVESWSP